MIIPRILGGIGLGFGAALVTAAVAHALKLSWLDFSDGALGPLALGTGVLVMCGSFLRMRRRPARRADD